jgi:hypothetical protein
MEYLTSKTLTTKITYELVCDKMGYTSESKGSHSTSNVIAVGLFSGGAAGFLTNGFEFLAVQKQTNPKF